MLVRTQLSHWVGGMRFNPIFCPPCVFCATAIPSTTRIVTSNTSSTEQTLRRAIVSRRAAAATPRRRRSAALHGRGGPPRGRCGPRLRLGRPPPARGHARPPPRGARSASAARARSRLAQSHLEREAAGAVGAGLPRGAAGGSPWRGPSAARRFTARLKRLPVDEARLRCEGCLLG